MPRSESGSPSPYPSPKRMRLSSPTYDEQTCLSQEEMQAFDILDRQLSQTTLPEPRPSQALSSIERRKRSRAVAFALDEGQDENRSSEVAGAREPLSPSSSPHRNSSQESGPKASLPTFPVFQSASTLHITRADGATDPISHNDSSSAPSDKDESATGAISISTPSRRSPSGFGSALRFEEEEVTDRAGADDLPSSSPDAAPEQDLATWFNSTSASPIAVGFQSAKSLRDDDAPSGSSDPAENTTLDLPGFTSGRSVLLGANPSSTPSDSPFELDSGTALVGFTSGINLIRPSQGADAGKSKAQDWTRPSKEALALAALKMKRWQEEIEEDLTDTTRIEEETTRPQSASIAPPPETPRAALRAVENSPAHPPDSPTPASTGFGRAGALGMKPAVGGKNKAFKSPLMNVATKRAAATPSYVGSPLNPNRSTPLASSSKIPAPAFTPLHVGTPAPAALTAFRSPAKALGLTPRRLGAGLGTPGKPNFTTPFKPGMKPGELGRQQLAQTKASQTPATTVGVIKISQATVHAQSKSLSKGKERQRFFDLSKFYYFWHSLKVLTSSVTQAKPPNRKTLATCGAQPQSYGAETLYSMGINVNQLDQVTPDIALYYSFRSPSSPTPPDSQTPTTMFGPDAALTELHEMGCSLAKKEWVENHWRMILWKLAGMACLQPERESNPETRRWCWAEVMKQLLYRYERELNSGSRPPLRLIAAQDAPPMCPMVLCVSKVAWLPTGPDEHGVARDTPELEVTDGWYRLRAVIDAPLERAMRKGLLRVGSKIAVANARVICERKEPAEILEAYDSMSLQISGNSSNPVPWHTKLGFIKQPPIATLDSLTPDGGLVTLMDLTVIKAHPIAFVEMIERDGKKITVGPLNEQEEVQAEEQWARQREVAVFKIRSEFENRMRRCKHIADRFNERAGLGWAPDDDALAPSDIEDRLMNLLDNPSSFAEEYVNTTREGAGWLSVFAEDYMAKARENLQDEIQRELEVRIYFTNLRDSC
ncbi:predicted protein [Postia placenta Mad-698-R]|nr:predicted protein [Postia placenta Mad-698-R]